MDRVNDTAAGEPWNGAAEAASDSGGTAAATAAATATAEVGSASDGHGTVSDTTGARGGGGPSWRTVVRLVILAVVSGVFVAAGVTKVWDPAEFARQIHRYRLVGPGVSSLLAVWLPWLELVIAAMLWPLATRRLAWWTSVSMLLAFTAALATAAARGLDIDCGCFGANGTGSTWWAMGRNIGLLVALFVIRPTRRGSGGSGVDIAQRTQAAAA